MRTDANRTERSQLSILPQMQLGCMVCYHLVCNSPDPEGGALLFSAHKNLVQRTSRTSGKY